MIKMIVHELKHHAPFTLIGTLVGAGIMALMAFWRVSPELSERLFIVVHPAHIFFSAIATTAMYRLHGRGKLWVAVLIGYVGAVGVGTISDCLIPYAGEWLMDMPRAHAHIGFIEDWWLVNPLALLGVAVACKWPKTKFPHIGHVLLSTMASLFHMTAAMGTEIPIQIVAVLPLFLFLAVWIPCCTSDIVFPLLLAGKAPRCSCQLK